MTDKGDTDVDTDEKPDCYTFSRVKSEPMDLSDGGVEQIATSEPEPIEGPPTSLGPIKLEARELADVTQILVNAQKPLNFGRSWNDGLDEKPSCSSLVEEAVDPSPTDDVIEPAETTGNDLGEIRVELNQSSGEESERDESEQVTLHYCDVCGELFKSLYTLDRHRKLHDGMMKCVICPVIFQRTSVRMYFKHLQRCVRSVKRNRLHGPFRCDICPHACEDISAYNSHILFHLAGDSRKDNAVFCVFCGQSLSSRMKRILYHCEGCQSFRKLNVRFGLRCYLCDETFEDKNDLLQHSIAVHICCKGQEGQLPGPRKSRATRSTTSRSALPNVTNIAVPHETESDDGQPDIVRPLGEPSLIECLEIPPPRMTDTMRSTTTIEAAFKNRRVVHCTFCQKKMQRQTAEHGFIILEHVSNCAVRELMGEKLTCPVCLIAFKRLHMIVIHVLQEHMCIIPRPYVNSKNFVEAGMELHNWQCNYIMQYLKYNSYVSLESRSNRDLNCPSCQLTFLDLGKDFIYHAYQCVTYSGQCSIAGCSVGLEFTNTHAFMKHVLLDHCNLKSENEHRTVNAWFSFVKADGPFKPEFVCPFCSLAFDLRKLNHMDVVYHVSYCAKKLWRRYDCPICEEILPRLQAVIRHSYVHVPPELDDFLRAEKRDPNLKKLLEMICKARDSRPCLTNETTNQNSSATGNAYFVVEEVEETDITDLVSVDDSVSSPPVSPITVIKNATVSDAFCDVTNEVHDRPSIIPTAVDTLTVNGVSSLPNYFVIDELDDRVTDNDAPPIITSTNTIEEMPSGVGEKAYYVIDEIDLDADERMDVAVPIGLHDVSESGMRVGPSALSNSDVVVDLEAGDDWSSSEQPSTSNFIPSTASANAIPCILCGMEFDIVDGDLPRVDIAAHVLECARRVPAENGFQSCDLCDDDDDESFSAAENGLAVHALEFHMGIEDSLQLLSESNQSTQLIATQRKSTHDETSSSRAKQGPKKRRVTGPEALASISPAQKDGKKVRCIFCKIAHHAGGTCFGLIKHVCKCNRLLQNDRGIYDCPSCPSGSKTFKEKRDLVRHALHDHMKVATRMDENNRRRTCSVIIKTRRTLIDSLAGSSNVKTVISGCDVYFAEVDGNFRCKGCDFKFKAGGSLLKHIPLCRGPGRGRKLDRSLPRPDSEPGRGRKLDRSLPRPDSEPGANYPCSRCDESFVYPSRLFYHECPKLSPSMAVKREDVFKCVCGFLIVQADYFHETICTKYRASQGLPPVSNPYEDKPGNSQPKNDVHSTADNSGRIVQCFLCNMTLPLDLASVSCPAIEHVCGCVREDPMDQLWCRGCSLEEKLSFESFADYVNHILNEHMGIKTVDDDDDTIVIEDSLVVPSLAQRRRALVSQTFADYDASADARMRITGKSNAPYQCTKCQSFFRKKSTFLVHRNKGCNGVQRDILRCVCGYIPWMMTKRFLIHISQCKPYMEAEPEKKKALEARLPPTAVKCECERWCLGRNRLRVHWKQCRLRTQQLD